MAKLEGKDATLTARDASGKVIFHVRYRGVDDGVDWQHEHDAAPPLPEYNYRIPLIEGRLDKPR